MAAPAVIRDDMVVIAGGALPIERSQFWLAKVRVVAGTRFVVVDRGDVYCRKFCGDEFAMLGAIVKARNEKVTTLMRQHELRQDVDPQADFNDEDLEPGRLKRPRSQTICELPDIIEVDVNGESSGRLTVKVLSDWHSRAKLFIEVTDANMQLLLDQPIDDDTQAFFPTIDVPHVAWNPDRHSVYSRLPSSASHRPKYKAKRIHEHIHTEAIQVDVNKYARKLGEWYRKHNAHCDEESSSMS
jgi:hypothetical protein